MTKTFEPSEELAAHMAQQADRLTPRAQEQGHNLDYSDASIAALERFIARMWVVGNGSFEGEKLAAFRDNLEFMAGAYLGETLRRNYGGAWGWSKLPDGTRVVGFEIGHKLVVAHPLAKVRKRLANGPEDSLTSFYDLAAHWDRVQAAQAAQAARGSPPEKQPD